MEEKDFLASYNIEKYERPSLTTDIVCFTIQTDKSICYRKDPVHSLNILLIKRGEHPFKDRWALPGGFVRPSETVNECAVREIKEETGVEPNYFMSVGTFSEPDRDPRGWVISNAYTTVISGEDINLKASDDALDAKWFKIIFEKILDEKNDIDNKTDIDSKINITLSNDDITIRTVLARRKSKFGIYEYEILENDGLAFDHAKIIASALDVLQSSAKDYEVVFEFLPEKFTLNSMQTVTETIMGLSLLTPNFRRKVASFIEETDEYIEGVGHRPARLYKRRL